jgi:hypothetical protein
MPRFVILRHELPPGHDRGTHFDLMLEMGGVLRTWELPELLEVGKVIQAKALPDHRLAYLEYEGPVSGNRGTVSRIEDGEYDMVEETGASWRYRLAGKMINGMLTLWRDEKSPGCWIATLSVE